MINTLVTGSPLQKRKCDVRKGSNAPTAWPHKFYMDYMYGLYYMTAISLQSDVEIFNAKVSI